MSVEIVFETHSASLDNERGVATGWLYPDGESWRQAVERVTGFLAELAHAHDGQRVVVIGHMATWYALECAANGAALEDVFYAPFQWKEGWLYALSTERPCGGGIHITP